MKNRSALAILFVIVFIDLLGFGMVIPVMPLYAERLGASEAWTGLLSAGYSAMQFVFAPIWGRLSDRIGRRPMLLASIVMTAVAFALYGLAGSFSMLLISRLFAGAATANIAIARAFVADVTAPEGIARAAWASSAPRSVSGSSSGPRSAACSRTTRSRPRFAAAALAAVNGIAAWFILPEPEHRFSVDRRPRFAAMREELARPGIRRVIGIYFITVLAFSAMEATYAFLARQRYGLAESSVGYVFAYIGVLLVIVQGGLVGRLSRRFGEKSLLVAGLVLQAIALASLPFGVGLTGLLARPRRSRSARASRSRRSPRCSRASRARRIRAARSGSASPPPRSAVSSVRRRGRGRSGSGRSRSLTSAARRSWRSRRRWA